MIVKRRSWALHILAGVRKAMGTSSGSLSDGSSNAEDRTRDGSLDVHGLPAMKKTSGGWKAAMFILVLQILTNTAFYSVANNLVIYLTTIMHQGNAAADKNVSNWNGTGYITPLLAAFLADSSLGRYRTALLSCLVYVVGLVLLTTSASVVSLHPPQCPSKDVKCQKATVGQVAFFYIGLYVMDLGAGGVYGTITAFGADQFDEADEKEKQQKNSFFNWFYQSVFTGSLIGSTFSVYIQDNVSWGLGWGMPILALLVGSGFLILGSPVYRYHKPGGNPLTRIWRIVAASFRKRSVALPANAGDLNEAQLSGSVIEDSMDIQPSDKFRCPEAATITDTDTDTDIDDNRTENRWQLCNLTQIDEVKFVIKVLPIWLTSIMYSAVYSQIGTLFVEQGATMNLHMGSIKIPPASLSVFESSSVILWVLVYDCLLVSVMRRITGNPRGISELQRIGVGLALSVVAMVVAATVEIRRLATAKEYLLMDNPSTPVPMTVFWEIPQFFLMGASEVFAYIGLLEFFYNESPDAIRSVGSSLSMVAIALGNFLSSLLVTVVNRVVRKNNYAPGWIADNLNRGRIDLFYWLLAALSSVNLAAFVICAVRYKYVNSQAPPDEADPPDFLDHKQQSTQLEDSDKRQVIEEYMK